MRFKNIPGILPALANSELSTTKLWQTHIDKISNYQLSIAVARAKFKDENTQIESELAYAIKQIGDAVYEGIIKPTKITQYKAAKKEHITTSALISGLLKLEMTHRKALLFALETNIALSEVVLIERHKFEALVVNSKLAKEVAESCLVSIKTKLLFWEQAEDKSHIGIVNLEQAVFEAFGCTYELLARKYANIIYDEWFKYLAS